MDREVEARLLDVDHILRRHVPRPLSLCPGRKEITSFVSLGQQLTDESKPRNFYIDAAEGLKVIVAAQINNFPDNIFWDYDYFCAVLFSQDSQSGLNNIIHSVESLMKTYGVHSELSFQFVHDFTYGFDWARWVSKKPEERRKYHLFTMEFFTYLSKRQGELVELIGKNDQKYNQLAKGKRRNPFKFSRTPEDEKIVLQNLSDQNMIPVPAWDISPTTRWNHDFTKIRENLVPRKRDSK